jgi:hypothetical protein
MAFPVPPDVRATRDFEFVLGQDELLRQSYPIKDVASPIDPGEWLKLVTDAGQTKAAKLEVADNIAAPALGCKVAWTKYRQGDSNAGQSDVLATGLVDLLGGNYQAKTKLYNTGGTFAPGHLLVPVYDATLGGILDAPDPAAPLTIPQLQAVVARVIEVADGVLHYEAPCL